MTPPHPYLPADLRAGILAGPEDAPPPLLDPAHTHYGTVCTSRRCPVAPGRDFFTRFTADPDNSP